MTLAAHEDKNPGCVHRLTFYAVGLGRKRPNGKSLLDNRGPTRPPGRTI